MSMRDYAALKKAWYYPGTTEVHLRLVQSEEQT
jgi:hypothetical protein